MSGRVVAGLAAVSTAAAVVFMTGRPDAGAIDDAVLGGVATGAAFAAWRLVRARRVVPDRRADDDHLDAVLSRLVQPVPVDEVLQQTVDALRGAPGRRAVELWQVQGDALVLTHRRPLVDRAPVDLPAEARSVFAAAGIVGDTWLRTWAPELAAEVDHDDTDRTRALPLATHGELAGLVVLRRDPGDAPFDERDATRLGRLRRPVAAALNQTRLLAALETSVAELQMRNEELQASRARLVTVADTERRRIERDLHDGAQARLTALSVRLQLARRIARDDPSRIDGVLEEIEADLVDTTAELRRLAHGIVSPLLMTGGLGDAVRGLASRLPVDVQVDAPKMTRMQPEIEAAVYHCCVEALQNTIKHAGNGASATVGLRHEDGVLRFWIDDDGPGPWPTPDPEGGQGLVNMADRIGALGGTITFGIGADGTGARVSGQVPVGSDDIADR